MMDLGFGEQPNALISYGSNHVDIVVAWKIFSDLKSLLVETTQKSMRLAAQTSPV
jgi:hypothetical protein